MEMFLYKAFTSPRAVWDPMYVPLHFITDPDGVGQVVGKFNFYMHKMAKSYENQNKQLLSEVHASNAAVESLTKERDDLIREKRALEMRSEKLLAKNVAANAEVERLQKELKVLRIEREQRKHSDKRKLKEFQLIRERLSKRSSESSPSPSDSFHSSASPTQAVHDDFMPEPLHGGGMRRRVLSFASGLDLKPSTEIQRLTLENEQYRYKLHQLEQKNQYLREELKQQSSHTEPLLKANETHMPQQKQPILTGDSQTEVLKGCLEESLEENFTLRNENSKLKQELEEAMAAHVAGSSPRHMLEKVAEVQGDVNGDKEGGDAVDTDIAMGPQSSTPIVQEIVGNKELDGIASNHGSIKTASRRNNVTVDHICDLLSKCAAVRNSLFLDSLDEIDSASPAEMGAVLQPCGDATPTDSDGVLSHGSQLCVDDSRSANLVGLSTEGENGETLVKDVLHKDEIPHEAWLTKDLTTVEDA